MNPKFILVAYLTRTYFTSMLLAASGARKAVTSTFSQREAQPLSCHQIGYSSSLPTEFDQLLDMKYVLRF